MENNESELRFPNEDDIPMEAMVRVINRSGRWIVMLNIPMWNPNATDQPITNRWRQINDYATQKDAEVAAVWYERVVNRSFGRSPELN